MEKFDRKKFDLETEQGTIIRGVIYTEKPSFNYTELLKLKDKNEEIKKLKILRNKLCLELRINKQDILIDEVNYKLWTSRRIILRHKQEIKSRNLIPAIIESSKDKEELEIEIEYL